jgi:hypothetical protein
MFIVIYSLAIIILFIIYKQIFTRKYYLNIGKSRRYRLYSNHFEVNVDGENYEFNNNGFRWVISGDGNVINVGAYDKFKMANTDFVIIDNSNILKYQRIASSIFSLIIVAPIAIGIALNINHMIPVNALGQKDIVAFITDGTTTYNQLDNEDYQSNDINVINDETLLSLSTNDVYLTACAADNYALFMSKDVVWHDKNDNDIPANELIGQKICLSFEGKHGENCYFVGQYNEDYNWDGECTICAYLDGSLYYVTEDIYENNRLISYKRLSSYNSRWIYTDKTIDDNGNTFGDTWSFNYKTFPEKEHTTKLPVFDDLYSVSEVKNDIDDLLLSHYHGAYDSNQSWFDISGEAYVIRYKDGKVEELFKGTVINSSYGEGQCIRMQDDNTFLVMNGVFHNADGQEVNKLTYETVTKADVVKYIENQKYEEEVNNAGWNYTD